MVTLTCCGCSLRLQTLVAYGRCILCRTELNLDISFDSEAWALTLSTPAPSTYHSHLISALQHVVCYRTMLSRHLMCSLLFTYGPPYSLIPSIHFLASSTPSSTLSAFVPCPIAVGAPALPPALPPMTGVTDAAHLGPSAPAGAREGGYNRVGSVYRLQYRKLEVEIGRE